MTHFPSLDPDAHLLNVFSAYPIGLEPLLKLHDEVLRGPGPLTIAECELIAAWTSAMNDCQFCYNAHKVYAEAFGVDGDLFDAMIADLDSAPIDEKLKPLLKYVQKLTISPSKILQADCDAVFKAGWSEEALHHAIMVTGIFNLMNRIIFGHGLPPHDSRYQERREEILQQSAEDRQAMNHSEIGSTPYADLLKSIKTLK